MDVTTKMDCVKAVLKMVPSLNRYTIKETSNEYHIIPATNFQDNSSLIRTLGCLGFYVGCLPTEDNVAFIMVKETLNKKLDES